MVCLPQKSRIFLRLGDSPDHVIVDRELITGQNPRSDHAIAAKLIEALAHYELKAA